MASDPDFEEFANFVASQHATLQHDAARLVGNNDLTRVLVLRALTEVAKSWRYASRSGPAAFLSKQLESQSRDFWREHPGEHDERDVTELTASLLAQQAWQSGLRARRRRTVGRVLMVAIVVIIAATYGVSVAFDTDGPQERTHQPETATSVSEKVAVIPPPGTTDKTPEYSNVFDDAAKPTAGTPWLKDDPVASMAGIVYGSSQSPVVIGQDGRQRRFDFGAVEDTATLVHPRSISPDGMRAALTPNNELAVLSVDGSLTTVEPQDDVGVIYDVAWIGERIQVTTSTGSYVVDPGTGGVVSREWYGPDSIQVTSADSPTVAEFVATETNPLTLRMWDGDEADQTASATARELPVQEWRSVPFNSRSTFARGCVVADTLEIPANYGSPHSCLAVVDSDASLQAMLVLTDNYSGSSQLLRFADGKVFFTVDAKSVDPPTVMVWQPDSNRMHTLFPLKNGQLLALGKI